MDTNQNAHRLILTEETVTILSRYSEFSSNYRADFSLREDGRIDLRLTRPDGVPFAGSSDPMDQKFAHLKNQTAVVRPFFFFAGPRSPWDESETNAVADPPDFDFAAIIGYGLEGETVSVKKLYFLPTDALIYGRKPGKDGVYRHLPLAGFNASQLSLDPRKTFARFLYLAERASEGLEYQYDKMGFFYSNP